MAQRTPPPQGSANRSLPVATVRRETVQHDPLLDAMKSAPQNTPYNTSHHQSSTSNYSTPNPPKLPTATFVDSLEVQVDQFLKNCK
jgi:hypothetical protein